MADQKLSELTPVTDITSADELYVNDGGTSKKITGTNVAAALQTGGIALDFYVTASITQASHPFSAGHAISHNGSSWVLADANNSLPCHAVVIEDVGTDTFRAAFGGKHTLTSHGFTLGQNYLSTTAGAVTTTQPGPGDIVQRVLVAIDANTVLVGIGEPLT